jgi:hypothetical protein
MTYTRRNTVEDQQEASQKVQKIKAACEQLHITLDPIDWQQYGMRAPVSVEGIEIASLMDFGSGESDDVLRRVQIKLFEHAAIEAIHAQPGLKAVMWSPVDVAQPQDFLSLWVITLETDERIPITESIIEGKRVYKRFTLDKNDEQQLAALFGPSSEGVYQPGATITIKEREHQYTGEVIYIIPPGKSNPGRKYASRGYHTIAGTAYTNDVTARYIVDCNDGFPHIVHQSQVIN